MQIDQKLTQKMIRPGIPCATNNCVRFPKKLIEMISQRHSPAPLAVLAAAGLLLCAILSEAESANTGRGSQL
jgi:hypothetical protein